MNSTKHPETKQVIMDGKAILGIEFGSTRIKAILIDEAHQPIASGSYQWENQLEDGVWTYSLDAIWKGLATSYQRLSEAVYQEFQVHIEQLSGIGISGMMHGYLVFDETGNQLVPFRTWRNTITEEAAEILTKQFDFNIPQRWSIAHLYQAILNKESHINDIHYLTTLAGYVHWMLTGQKVVGVGEASGIFPIDSIGYNQKMLEKFEEMLTKEGIKWHLNEILPTVMNAGALAGTLTSEGAKRLDPKGYLKEGIPFCPPEGDAGTGMVATNSVREGYGNVSAGTSIFAMVVLEKPLSQVYTEIDMVTTPTGKPVAMVHCNNCTSDLNAWITMFREILEKFGAVPDESTLFETLYRSALEGEADGGGLLAYNYYAGEPITKTTEGRPVFARMPDSQLNTANFMRTLLYSSLATLEIGMNILTEREQVQLARLLGHGGLFKTKEVGQKLLAGALQVPVVVMESAGEGGAFGIAILAAYMKRRNPNQDLESYLEEHVFNRVVATCIEPVQEDIDGFKQFIERYTNSLEIEHAAIKTMQSLN